MAKRDLPNPFSGAKKVTPAASAPKGSVYVASTLMDENGRELFTGEQVAAAVQGFCEGHDLEQQAKTLKETNRPIIDRFGQFQFANEWARTRKLPENPSISANQAGGAMVKYIIQDRGINVNDDEQARIANLIGADNLGEAVVDKVIFTLNGDVLDQEVALPVYDAKGKKTGEDTATVMDHLAAAIQEKFKDKPELITVLFTQKPVKQTAKGLIEKGLALAVPQGLTGPAAAHRLVDFIGAIKAPCQVKPVTSGTAS